MNDRPPVTSKIKSLHGRAPIVKTERNTSSQIGVRVLTVGEIRQPWGITTQFSDTTLRFPGLIPDKSGLVQPVYLAVPDNYLVLANQKIANMS